MSKTYLTPAEAAIELGLTDTGVRTAIRRGQLSARKVMGRLRLDPEVVAKAARGAPAGQEPPRREAASPTI